MGTLVEKSGFWVARVACLHPRSVSVPLRTGKFAPASQKARSAFRIMVAKSCSLEVPSITLPTSAMATTGTGTFDQGKHLAGWSSKTMVDPSSSVALQAFRKSHAMQGSHGDWDIKSGKSKGRVRIQNGGGTIELLGGGASQPSLIGDGKMQDWRIRSGNNAGTVHIQDKGGETTIGGKLNVLKDIKIGGHLFLSSAKGEEYTMESKLMAMEAKMEALMETNARLEAMMQEMRSK